MTSRDGGTGRAGGGLALTATGSASILAWGVYNRNGALKAGLNMDTSAHTIGTGIYDCPLQGALASTNYAVLVGNSSSNAVGYVAGNLSATDNVHVITLSGGQQAGDLEFTVTVIGAP